MESDALRRFVTEIRDAANRLLATLDALDTGEIAPPTDDQSARQTELETLQAELKRLVPGATQKRVLGLTGLYSHRGMSTEEVRMGLGVTEVARRHSRRFSASRGAASPRRCRT